MGNFDVATGQQLRDVLASLFSFASEDDRNLLYGLLGAGAGSFIATFTKAADDGMASTTTAETGIGPMNPFNAFPWSVSATARQLRCLGGRVLATTATGVTLNDTNFATISVFHRTAAGATQTAAIAATTKTVATDPQNSTGTWPATAFSSVPLPPTSTSGVVMAAGGGLTYSIAKGGAGVIVPAFIAHVYAALN